MNDDHIPDASKMATPRTDDVRHYLRTRSDFTETDGEVWYRFGTILERELAESEKLLQKKHEQAVAIADKLHAANAHVKELEHWIRGLDVLVDNPTDHRQWHGDIGWVRPGQCAYVGPRKPDGLC